MNKGTNMILNIWILFFSRYYFYFCCYCCCEHAFKGLMIVFKKIYKEFLTITVLNHKMWWLFVDYCCRLFACLVDWHSPVIWAFQVIFWVFHEHNVISGTIHLSSQYLKSLKICTYGIYCQCMWRQPFVDIKWF